MLPTAAILLFAAAALLLLAAAGLGAAKLSFLSRAARATGTVSALHSDGPAETGGSRQTMRPVIRFATPAGGEVEFTMAVGSRTPRYRIGDAVPVRYDPAAPAASARVQSFLGLWFAPSLLGGMAVPALIAGAGLLLWHGATGRDLAELRRSGKITTATVMEIDIAPRDKDVDGTPMYVLKLEAEESETGRRLSFVSDAIESEIRHAYAIGDKVVVIFDPADPARYYVEVR